MKVQNRILDRISRTLLGLLLLPYVLWAGVLPPQNGQNSASDAETTALPAASKIVGKLRIGTWNLLNLFDNYDNPAKPDEGTSPKSSFDLKIMARQIDAMNVDVLGVQEVENRAALLTLNKYLERPFLHVELIEGNDFRGIDVGILSRVPIESATSHRLRPLDSDHLFARDFPVFRLRPHADLRIDVGVVHLKSKRGKKKRSDGWRQAEAAGIARIIKERTANDKDIPFFVMGDFNDYRDSATLSPLMSSLIDYTLKVPKEDRYSFIYRGAAEQIDFVLGSHDLPVTKAQIFHPRNGASDHAPMVVEIGLAHKINRPDVAAPKKPEGPQRPQLRYDDLKEFQTNLLKEVEVSGKVVKVFHAKSGQFAILNFHNDHRRAITAYIQKEAFARLPDLKSLVGRRLKLLGPLSIYRGVYQIKITRKAQIVLN